MSPRWLAAVLLILVGHFSLNAQILNAQTTVMPLGGSDPYAIVGSQSAAGWFGNGFTMPTTNSFRDRIWLRLEYLRWKTAGMDLPPLVTTSPAGTLQSDAGVLGAPGTSILAGAGTVNGGSTNGVRWRSGIWSRNGQFGFEGEFFRLNGESEGYSASSDGSTILARPYFDALTGLQSARLLSFPNVVEGGVGISTKSHFRSGLINGRASLVPVNKFCADPCNPADRIDWIVGYRYLELKDNVVITDNTNSLLTISPGSAVSESFEAKNQFNGLQLGIVYQAAFKRAKLESMMRVAIGNNRQQVRIRGNTVISNGGATQNYNGGLLAQRSNIGDFNRDRFTMVPEVGLTLGFRLTNFLHATLGYSVLYFPTVVRSGEQIDTDVNSNLIPVEANPFSGPLRPAFSFQESSYWTQGVNLGAELNF